MEDLYHLTHLTDHRNSKYSSVQTLVTVECECELIVTLPCQVQAQIHLDQMLIEYWIGGEKKTVVFQQK